MVSNLLVVLCGERATQPVDQHRHDLSVDRRGRAQAVPASDRPAVLDAVQRWADDDLRSLNGQIEFLLRKALADSGRLKDGRPPASKKRLGLFVLFFVRRQRAGRRAQRLAVVVERQVADVERQRAARCFLDRRRP